MICMYGHNKKKTNPVLQVFSIVLCYTWVLFLERNTYTEIDFRAFDSLLKFVLLR